MEKKGKIVLFSDIDGIMFEEKGVFAKTISRVLCCLEKLDIPIVLTSRRSKAELEFFIKKFELQHPFIPEGGGGIFIPLDYFPFNFLYSKNDDEYKIIELGASYLELRKMLRFLERKIGCELRGFCDMPVDEIAELFNISAVDAKLVKIRYYEEPFVLVKGKYEKELFKQTRKLKVSIRKYSNYYCISRKCDVGKAIKLLIRLYERKYSDVISIGIGCRKSDIAMLSQVDLPILLPHRRKGFISVDIKNIEKVDCAGVKGWEKAVVSVIGKLGKGF